MEITAGLLTKAGCGLGATGLGVTGIYFGGEYISNMLSNYEKALIGFLEGGENHDIKFEVKKGSGTFSEADLALSGNDAVSVFAKVQVTGSTTSSFKNGSNNATDEEMKKIKVLGGGNWTWECGFKFTKDAGINDSTIDTKYKDQIFKSANGGLLGMLQEELTNKSKEEDKKQLKQLKIDFIKKCGNQRTPADNKELNGKSAVTANDLKVEIPIEFVKKSDANTLVPKEGKDSKTFDYWFKNNAAGAGS